MAQEELTEAEAQVYDRQLRVWGVEVQKRLNRAKILIVGANGVAAEVAKNLVLAGIGSLTLMADAPCSACHATNFLIPAQAPHDASAAEVSAATLQEMNPLVKVRSQPGSWQLPSDASTLQQYDAVLLAGAPLQAQLAWDEAYTQQRGCPERPGGFFVAASRGVFAYFFANLHRHTFTPEEVKQAEGATGAQQAPAPQTWQFASLRSALQRPWSSLSAKEHQLPCLLRACAAVEAARDEGRPLAAADLPAVQAQLATQLGAERSDQQLPAKFVADPSLVEAWVGGEQEMPALNAVLGGVLANELLKAVSCRGEPLRSWFIYDLFSGEGCIQKAG